MQFPDRASPSAIRWTWIFAGLFTLVGLFLFTRHADFPYLYHTDEPSKIGQIIDHDYNFHHPLLLLRSTEALVGMTSTPLQPQPVVEKGRLASAIFAALGTGFTVMLASRLAGRVAGVFAGILVLTHPVLFELSHYMKEDCALLVGIAATLAGLVHYASRPSLGRAVLVGVAAGLALSGKYLGCTVAIFALVALAWNPAGKSPRWLAAVVAVAGMAGCFAAINYPALQDTEKAKSSLTQELEKVEKRAEERPEPIRFKHLSKLGTTLSVPLLIGLAYWFGRRWRLRRHEPLIWRAVGMFLIAYFLIVSLAPKTKDRYLLPVYIVACALGSVGVVEWYRHYRKHRSPYTRGLPRTVAIAAIVWHLPAFADTYSAFKRDDRRELAEFIRITIPPDAGIAQDVRVLLARAKAAGLPAFSLPNPLLVPPDRYVADLGSIEDLRARGITHVAVCEADYHNAFKDSGNPKMAERSRWYAELFRNHSEVWQRKVGDIAYLQPGLRLYRITPDTPPPPPSEN